MWLAQILRIYFLLCVCPFNQSAAPGAHGKGGDDSGSDYGDWESDDWSNFTIETTKNVTKSNMNRTVVGFDIRYIHTLRYNVLSLVCGLLYTLFTL